MGWESNNVFQVLIIQGSTGSGLFVYSPSPARGNLVASIAAATGTDAFGNVYLAGVNSYAPSPTIANFATQINSGFLQFFNAPAGSNGGGPWSQTGFLTGNTAPHLQIATALITSQFQVEALLAALGGIQVTLSGNDVIALQNALAAGQVLRVINTTAAPTSPNTLLTSAAAGDATLGLRVSGDTDNRLRVDANGTLKWGPGNAVIDTQLSRSAANTLAVGAGDLFTADQEALSSGQAAGDVLKVTNTTAAPTNPTAELIGQTVGDDVLGGKVTGDAFPRWKVNNSGGMFWGTGAAAPGNGLTRSASQVMSWVAALNLNNSAIPAAPANGVDIFSDAGNKLAMLPATGTIMQVPGWQLATFPGITVTQATLTTIASATYPANDAEVGSVYELDVEGNGTWGSTAQTLEFQVTFGGNAMQNVTLGSAFFAVSTIFRWKVHARVICHTTGTTGTWTSSIEGEASVAGANVLPTAGSQATSGFCVSESTTMVTVNTTVNQTLALQCAWGSTTGAPTLTSRVALFGRVA